MRKVIFYRWERIKDNPSKFEKIIDGSGLFHQWGCDYEEFESGPGNFSTAIIELPDGSIKNIYAEMIEFVEKERE
jgi:hypothetical protein